MQAQHSIHGQVTVLRLVEKAKDYYFNKEQSSRIKREDGKVLVVRTSQLTFVK